MLLTLAICCALPFVLLLHHLLVAQRRFIVGPESLFILMGTGTFAATLWAAAESGDSAHPYVIFIGSGLLLFVLGTMASRFLFRFEHGVALERFVARSWIDDLHSLQFHVVLGIGIVSILITFVYFYTIGFFVPQEALRALLASGQEEMSLVYNELRRQSTFTGGGAGYVFQFKNCLLPLITVILFFRLRIHLGTWSRLLFLVFLTATVLAAVGTGARFALASFAASFALIGSSRFMAPLGFTRRQIVAVAVGALLFLSFLTLMMGARGQEKRVGGGLLWAPIQVMDRVFVFPAREKFEVYEAFLRHEGPKSGRGLLTELEIILPGRDDYTLSNQLHELVYGSASGNVALDVWGSMWYDFQWLGLAFFFVYGFLCNWYYISLLRGQKRLVRIVVLAYAGIVLGLATDLQVLILRGFVTCLLFLGIVYCARLLQSLLAPSPSMASS